MVLTWLPVCNTPVHQYYNYLAFTSCYIPYLHPKCAGGEGTGVSVGKDSSAGDRDDVFPRTCEYPHTVWQSIKAVIHICLCAAYTVHQDNGLYNELCHHQLNNVALP